MTGNRRMRRRGVPVGAGCQTGFTLVELLVTIAIIGILAGLLLGVASVAANNGREARTKALITRLHTLVMEQYDSYRYRRVELNNDIKKKVSGKELAEARLYALRELMLMEMPDRWSDVLLRAVTDDTLSDSPASPLYLAENTTPLVEAYRRQYYQMVDAGKSAEDIADNQGAECLYLLVMYATADGEARSLFNESSIGDVDGDGAPEFIDGWGKPISFIRWAPGVESDLQANANRLGESDSSEWLETARNDHDPFDMFRQDPLAFRLVPLIYSAGSDERYDLYTARGSTFWPPLPTTELFLPEKPKLTIFRTVESKPKDSPPIYQYLGTPMDESGLNRDLTAGGDNLTNHALAAD